MNPHRMTTSSALAQFSSGTSIKIAMFTRLKLNSEWVPSSLQPERMGKSRKCTVFVGQIEGCVKLHVTSSNPGLIHVGLKQNISANSIDRFAYLESQELEPPCEFSFFIAPVERARGAAQISLFISNSAFGSTPKLIMDWNIHSMGHKFETSKKGKLLSQKSPKSREIVVCFGTRISDRHIKDFLCYDVPKISNK